MQILKAANLVLMFLLELGMLAALGYSGFKSSQHPYGKYLTGIGLPLVAAILWGIFAAPRSKYRFPQPWRAFLGLPCLALVRCYFTG